MGECKEGGRDWRDGGNLAFASGFRNTSFVLGRVDAVIVADGGGVSSLALLDFIKLLSVQYEYCDGLGSVGLLQCERSLPCLAFRRDQRDF